MQNQKRFKQPAGSVTGELDGSSFTHRSPSRAIIALRLNKSYSIGFEVLTAVVMKSPIFWNITPCIPLIINRRFGGPRRLHFHEPTESAFYLLHTGFLLCLFFDHGDGGEMFFRNVG
jgi:hypothetical protein